MLRKYWLATLIAVGLFVLDRLTRIWAFQTGSKTLIPKLILSSPIKNPGIALGINLPFGQVTAILVSLILIGIVVWLAWHGWKQKNFFTWLSANLIFFGAMSNFLDRLVYGNVRDFLKFSFWPTTNNLGDLMVLIGVIILILTFHSQNTKN